MSDRRKIGNALVPSIAWLAIGLLSLAAVGCARSPDWIEQTLVTVDVTGVWRGDMATSGSKFPWELTLQQVGSKVTGQLRQEINASSSGPIEGRVNGDTFHFRTARGATGELHVNGDEMTGPGTAASGGQASFSLRRQP